MKKANMEDPKKYLNVAVNKFLKRRILLVRHFPGELIRARRNYRERADG